MNYGEFIKTAYQKAEEKGIPDIFANETNQVETGYDRKVSDEIFKLYAVIPSYFNAPEEVDTSLELFGHTLAMPILPSPMSRLTNVTDKPMVKIAQAAKNAGTMATLGISGEDLLAEITAVGVPALKIIKPYRDFAKMKSMLAAARQNRFAALGVDLDYSFGKKNGDQIFLADTFSPKSAEQIRELAELAGVPFVIKGSLSVRDALIAQETGCNGLIVSNHGNSTIDYLAQPLEVLPQIRAAVGAEMKIIVDGGIRRGSDIFKCLALGADAVCVGRMTWMGLIVDEANGVTEIYRILNDELKRYMRSTGAARLTDIKESMLLKRGFILA